MISGDPHRRPVVGVGEVDEERVLSDFDLQIIGMIADGWGLDTVARRLNVSSRTVRRHTLAMRDRLGARAPIQIAVWAARRGLI